MEDSFEFRQTEIDNIFSSGYLYVPGLASPSNGMGDYVFIGKLKLSTLRAGIWNQKCDDGVQKCGVRILRIDETSVNFDKGCDPT